MQIHVYLTLYIQPGTRCQTISMTRRSAKTLLGDRWRRTQSHLRCITARSASEALPNALYNCSTYLLACSRCLLLQRIDVSITCFLCYRRKQLAVLDWRSEKCYYGNSFSVVRQIERVDRWSYRTVNRIESRWRTAHVVRHCRRTQSTYLMLDRRWFPKLPPTFLSPHAAWMQRMA